MELEQVRLQTTWNDAAGSINNNYAKIADAIAQLKSNGGGGGGGADIDLTDYATKVWVEAKGYITASALTPYLKTEDAEETYATKDFVDNKLVDYAPLTSIQGFENRIGGLEDAVPKLNDRVTTVESKVSTLNETVSTGKNNLLDRVNTIETDYVTSGNLESAINGIDLSAYLLKADLTKSRIQSTLGISDWALAATKPSYTAAEVGALAVGGTAVNSDKLNGLSKSDFVRSYGDVGANYSKGNWVGYSYVTEAHGGSTVGGVISAGNEGWGFQLNGGAFNDGVYYRAYSDGTFNTWCKLAFTSDIPTKLSQFTDDVVAGKYLPLSGGNIVSDKELILTIISSSPNSYAMFYANGRNRASVGYYKGLGYIANEISYARIGVTDTGEPQYWDSYRTDANKYTLLHSGNIGNYNAGSANILQAPSNKYYVTANTRDDNWKVALKIGGWDSRDAGFATQYGTAVDIAGFNTWYHRLGFNTNGTIEHWMGINTTKMSRVGYLAYITSNVASATKLKTPRKLWGNDFDGTADVSGNLYSDIWRVIKDATWNGTFIQSANYDGTSELGNIYMTAMHGSKLISFNVWANNSEFSDNVTVAGNVGIGNTSPTERLDVSGNIKASGNINATSITINGVTISASNGSITVNGNVFATGDMTGGV